MSGVRIFFFILFALIAGFTKQTMFALIVGALIGFFVEGDAGQKKRVIAIGVLYIASALITFLSMQIITDGGFYQSVVVSALISMKGHILREKTVSVLSDPIGMALILLGLGGSFRKKHRGFMIPFVLIPVVSAIGSAGKTGSNINYFLELIGALSLGMALFMGEKDSESNLSFARAKVIVCVVLLLGVVGAMFVRAPVFGKWYRQWQNIEKFHQPPGSVIFMKRYLRPGSMVYAQHSQLPLFAGCVPVLSDPFNIADMIRIGKWNSSALISAFKNQEIGLVLMREQVTTSDRMEFMSEDVARTVLENYTLIKSRPDGFFTYLPNKVIRQTQSMNR
jgi:hypothetical protein